jgi:peptidoglycan/xylan/chitin deacetylase (PgdA/CDA1 family)
MKNNRDIKIFLFHRVSPEKDSIWPPMHPELFEEVIKYLNKIFHIVKLEDYLLNDDVQISKNKKAAAVVFDDGYKDFMNYGLPILQKYNIPSSMYVVTNSVYQNIPPWTYVINYLFTHTQRNYIELESSFIPENLKTFNWTNEKQKISYVKKLSPYLKGIINLERTSIYDQILEQFNDVELPYGKMLSWKEINEIIGEGCEIGSHSVSHPLLSQSLYSDRIKHELELSAQIIFKETGKYPISISYPFGDCDYRVIKMAKEIGYKIGLGVNPRGNFQNAPDLFNIPRIELFNESFIKTKLRINGTLQYVKNLLGTS